MIVVVEGCGQVGRGPRDGDAELEAVAAQGVDAPGAVGLSQAPGAVQRLQVLLRHALDAHRMQIGAARDFEQCDRVGSKVTSMPKPTSPPAQ